MNDQIRRAIRSRARSARNKQEVVQAVFDGLAAHRIDYRHVSLEEMKRALVEAAREARRETGISLIAV